MKLARIILLGTLGLGLLALTGSSIDKGNSQSIETRRHKNMYMCPMMETESMKEMQERCMQYHKEHMNREETNNYKHQEYGCCM